MVGRIISMGATAYLTCRCRAIASESKWMLLRDQMQRFFFTRSCQLGFFLVATLFFVFNLYWILHCAVQVYLFQDYYSGTCHCGNLCKINGNRKVPSRYQGWFSLSRFQALFRVGVMIFTFFSVILFSFFVQKSERINLCPCV